MRECIGAYNTKTRPSLHAMKRLADCVREPFPAQEVNFTVRDKLHAWGYVTIEQRPSPYKTHKGRKIDFLVATPAGIAALAEAVKDAR